MEPVMTPKQHQREQEANHEQKHEHMKHYTDPRCKKNGEKGELLEKQGYGESTMLSSDWERSLNFPPPSGAVPPEMCYATKMKLHRRVWSVTPVPRPSTERGPASGVSNIT
jgi:hypothetical protein